MTLTGKWAKDRTGTLVMKWTEDQGPMPNPQPRRPAQESRTRNHERRATGPVVVAMLPASPLPETSAASRAPHAHAGTASSVNSGLGSHV